MIISPISVVVSSRSVASWTTPSISSTMDSSLGVGTGRFLAGFQKSLQNFLALEALAAAVLLDDHVRDFIDAFVGGEAAGTFQAFTAAADGVAGAALTRINYLVIDVRAEGALHSKVSPLGTVEPLCGMGGREGNGVVEDIRVAEIG